MLKLTSITIPSYHHHIKPTSATQHSTVISLLKEGYSVCQIESKTGLGRSTVGRIRKKTDLDKENSKGGCSSKLFLVIHSQLSVKSPGKLNNAVQAAHFINDILPSPVTPQTARNAPKERNFTLLSSKNDHCSNRLIDKTILSLLKSMKNGQWRTGKGLCSQMRQKSTGLGQMEGCILGRRREHHFLPGLSH